MPRKPRGRTRASGPSSYWNNTAAASGDILALDRDVSAALEFAPRHPGDTLVVVTGDHETGGMTLRPAPAGRSVELGRIGWTTSGHTGVPVSTFASGAGQELFAGGCDNTDIFRKLMAAMGLGSATGSASTAPAGTTASTVAEKTGWR